MICPAMNCHSGVGEMMTWSNAFSYNLWTFKFWAIALKLPFMVVRATTPGIRSSDTIVRATWSGFQDQTPEYIKEGQSWQPA